MTFPAVQVSKVSTVHTSILISKVDIKDHYTATLVLFTYQQSCLNLKLVNLTTEVNLIKNCADKLN